MSAQPQAACLVAIQKGVRAIAQNQEVIKLIVSATGAFPGCADADVVECARVIGQLLDKSLKSKSDLIEHVEERDTTITELEQKSEREERLIEIGERSMGEQQARVLVLLSCLGRVASAFKIPEEGDVEATTDKIMEAVGDSIGTLHGVHGLFVRGPAHETHARRVA